jgi:hypothetical protein
MWRRTLSVQGAPNNRATDISSAIALIKTVRISHRGLGEEGIAEQLLGGATERLANRPEFGQIEPPIAELNPRQSEARHSDQRSALRLGHPEGPAALAHDGADASTHRVVAVHGLCSVEAQIGIMKRIP